MDKQEKKQNMKQDRLIDWAKRLQSLAQAGLTYGKDNFDLERYQEIRDISAEMIIKLLSLQLGQLFSKMIKFCSFRKMMVLGQSQVVGVK